MNTSQTDKTSGNSSWLPVIMSIVVYPGVGQWMQKRRNIAMLYMVAFTIMALLFTWILVVYLQHVIPIVVDALEGNSVEGQKLPPLKQVLRPFAIVMFIYTANVFDAVRGRMILRKSDSVA